MFANFSGGDDDLSACSSDGGIVLHNDDDQATSIEESSNGDDMSTSSKESIDHAAQIVDRLPQPEPMRASKRQQARRELSKSIFHAGRGGRFGAGGGSGGGSSSSSSSRSGSSSSDSDEDSAWSSGYTYSTRDSAPQNQVGMYEIIGDVDQFPNLLKLVCDQCKEVRMLEGHVEEYSEHNLLPRYANYWASQYQNGEPVSCAHIGRVCFCGEDELDEAVESIAVTDRHGNQVRKETPKEQLFPGVSRLNSSVNYYEVSGYRKAGDYWSHQSLLVERPSFPPDLNPNNTNISFYHRLIETATADRPYNHMWTGLPCTTIRHNELEAPTFDSIWDRFRPEFEAMEATAASNVAEGYSRRAYAGGSTRRKGLRVRELMDPISSYIGGGYTRQCGKTRRYRAKIVMFVLPLRAGTKELLGKIERVWVDGLRSKLSDRNIELINSKNISAGGGGYAWPKSSARKVHLYLEIITFDYYNPTAEPANAIAEAFLRNSKNMRIIFPVDALMKALGIHRGMEGLVEYRCPRNHPVAGYWDCIRLATKQEIDDGDEKYVWNIGGVRQHHRINHFSNNDNKCVICCHRCSQLGYGMRGKGNYEYINFDITRVAELRDDGTVFIWSRYGQPMEPQQEQEQDSDEEDVIGGAGIDVGQDDPPVNNIIINGGTNQGSGDEADGSDSEESMVSE